MRKIIKIGEPLKCGCCGKAFAAWKNFQSFDCNNELGVCQSCEELRQSCSEMFFNVAIDAVKEYIDSHYDKDEPELPFDDITREGQEIFVLHLLNNNMLDVTVLPANNTIH